MTKPYQYQLEGADFVEAHDGRALIGDEMGLGKSLQALLFAEANKSARPIVVVCPASIKFNWQNEAAKHIGMTAEILSGRKPPKNFRQRFHQFPMLIINYEILADWADVLKRLKPQLLILDEIHRLKSMKAICTKAAHYISQDIPNIIALGGTPMLNTPSELWSVLHILQPEQFPNYNRFCFSWCVAKHTKWGWTFGGIKSKKHAKRLHKLLTLTCMIRRLKKDVLKDLPPRTKIILPVAMSNPKEYQKAKDDFRNWLSETEPQRAKKSSRSQWRMEAWAKSGYLLRLAAQLKLQSVYDWIDDYLEETDNKILLFGIHKKFLGALHERYEHNSVMLTGETAVKKRKHVIEKFNNDKQTRLMFGNLIAAGVGWNCTCTSTVAHLELAWRPADHIQASDRCHGLNRGQKGVPLTEYYLVAKDSAEERLLEILQQKQEGVDLVLDGKEGVSEFNILDKFVDALLETDPLEGMKRRRRKR